MNHGEKLRRADLKRYVIYRMKQLELLHFYLLLQDLNESGHCPANDLDHDGRMFASSVRTVTISWLATFVDTSRNGMNVFDLWRRLFPKFKDEIDAVWDKLKPQLKLITNFRTKVGFHAASPMKYFAARDKIRGKNPQLQVAINAFIDLQMLMFKHEEEELPDFFSSAEDLLLDVELKLKISVDREWFRQALILPRKHPPMAFG